jgi:hypothetical protein
MYTKKNLVKNIFCSKENTFMRRLTKMQNTKNLLNSGNTKVEKKYIKLLCKYLHSGLYH